MSVFVVRLVAHELAEGRIAGEVESIGSGVVAVVRSAEELLAHLRADGTAVEVTAGGAGPSGGSS